MPRQICARFGCDRLTKRRGRQFCSPACAARARVKPLHRCARPGCGQIVAGRAYNRYCSKSCGARMPRTNQARSKACAACGQVFTRRFPSELAETCGKRCEGDLKHRRWAEKRLPHVQKRWGVLSRRERELFAAAYMAGYQRGRQRFIRPPAYLRETAA